MFSDDNLLLYHDDEYNVEPTIQADSFLSPE